MHVNEQPMEYWINKFYIRGYKLIDIRPYFKDDYDIETWYKENIGLYVLKENYDEYIKLFNDHI